MSTVWCAVRIKIKWLKDISINPWKINCLNGDGEFATKWNGWKVLTNPSKTSCLKNDTQSMSKYNVWKVLTNSPKSKLSERKHAVRIKIQWLKGINKSIKERTTKDVNKSVKKTTYKELKIM